jgi:hypothetical protein
MWQHGVAKLIEVARDKVNILCPHCGKNHQHSRHSLGSKEVVSGCHLGGRVCRSYSIPAKK